eukprot:jgi/Botrbrau1/11913/Bobra.0259s0002.1
MCTYELAKQHWSFLSLESVKDSLPPADKGRGDVWMFIALWNKKIGGRHGSARAGGPFPPIRERGTSRMFHVSSEEENNGPAQRRCGQLEGLSSPSSILASP